MEKTVTDTYIPVYDENGYEKDYWKYHTEEECRDEYFRAVGDSQDVGFCTYHFNRTTDPKGRIMVYAACTVSVVGMGVAIYFLLKFTLIATILFIVGVCCVLGQVVKNNKN